VISLEEAAAFCDKVKWQGKNSFLACCVAHDDKNPSMSVTDKDGKLLIHCHAGCSQDAVMHAMGMTGVRDHRHTSITPKRPKTESATYKYARQIWQRTKPNDWVSWDAEVSSHPYAIKKQIRHACGAARGAVTGSLIGKDADCIILPMRTVQGALTGLECINADGVKQTFGTKGVLVLGNTLDASLDVHICEGWADAVSVWRMNGNVNVIAVFGNRERQLQLAACLNEKNSSRNYILERDSV
jgi:hypothetical protein